ncbi:aldehyde dehydrogenase family 3 member A2-like isoform X1 [Lampetra fluviatilis]
MADFQEMVSRARQAFRTGRSRDIAFREEQLRALNQLMEENEKELCQSLYKDLHKCKFEVIMHELVPAKNDMALIASHLREWAKPQPVSRSLITLADTVYIEPQPLGVCLIMGAWNYPGGLVFQPLAGAIAAGNAAVIKPSELSENTAKLLAELFPRYLDKDMYQVVLGGPAETTELLKQRFDHIFYTGGPAVARIVMAAAVPHLTPVLLELGGKSPCFVHRDSNLQLAARRITWGRFINSGQTCIAPDYVLCEPSVQEPLVEAIRVTLKEYYGEDPKKSLDYGRIVNKRHFDRVKGLMAGAKVAIGGETDEAELYIAPTVLTGVDASSAAMQEEIFGPILPIMTVNGVDDAITFINDREKPLAIYVFALDKKVVKRLVDETSSGGFTSNDTLFNYAVEGMPFGGVGNSGMGSYHGRHSFNSFSHMRAVGLRGQSMESANTIRYPPYSDKKLSWCQWAIGKKMSKGGRGGRGTILSIALLGLALVGAFAALLTKVNNQKPNQAL